MGAVKTAKGMGAVKGYGAGRALKGRGAVMPVRAMGAVEGYGGYEELWGL